MEHDFFLPFAERNMNWLMITVWFGWVLVIFSESGDNRLERIKFAAIVLATLVVVIAIMTKPAGYLFSFLGSTSLVRLTIFVFAVAVLLIACVQRSRDIGWGRWVALLVILPVVNIIVWLLLLAWPGRPNPPRPVERRPPLDNRHVRSGPVTLRRPPRGDG